MLTSFLDTIGDWNPQLLRELKGQLKPIKIGLAIALSLITQVVFLLIVWGQLPGWLDPSDLSVTTYPKIQTDYSGTGPIAINYLEYDYPLEKHPNYDITAKGLEQYSYQVKVGDRITAIDDQPFTWEETGENTLSKQTLLDTAMAGPFADEIPRLTIDVHALDSAVISAQAAQTLRQQVPGTTVKLTLLRQGVSEPFDVILPRIVSSTRTSSYCLPLENWQTQVSGGTRRYSPCSVSVGAQQYQINWLQWHRDAFWGLSITILFPFLILSTYAIINNLLKEERDGTLNFIRLSPQSAGEILLGKMLGVPALIYWAVAVAVPLHWFHGLSAGLGWGGMVALYAATVAIAFLTFSMALLLGMINLSLGMVQAWLGGGSVLLIQMLSLQASRYSHSSDGNPLSWALLFSPLSLLRGTNAYPFVDDYSVADSVFQWFGIPMVPVVMLLLLLANAALLSRWIWHALERRFFNSSSTLLSKAQSYGLTLAVNIAAVGFSWSSWSQSQTMIPEGDPKLDYSSASPPLYWLEDHLLFLLLINAALWVMMIVALTPQRQSLHDWARYRHLLPAAPQRNQQPWNSRSRRSLWFDLVWGEKSPIVVAIALNLLIGALCIFLWTLYQAFSSMGNWSIFAMSIFVTLQHSEVLSLLALAFVVLLSTTNILLICTTIAQLICLKREKHALSTALLSLIVLLMGIPITLGLTSANPGTYPAIWFILFPWASIFEPLSFVGAGILGLLGQWTVLGLLNWWLFHWIEKIGTSASKELLTGAQGVLPE